MRIKLITRSVVVSTAALAVSMNGFGIAQASPDAVNQDNQAGRSHSGKTARNNTNGLDWGDDWSLGGFPPINLSSLPAPNVNLSVPLSLGLPGLSLPSLNLNLFH